jgi:hypothetical protein
MAEMRAWMLAKLLWNPALDAGRLRQEFLKGYYGPMAPQVSEYLALLENAVLATGDHLGCFSPSDAQFLSLETMLDAWDILRKAEAKTAKNAEFIRRIKRVQMPVAYVVLVRWDGFQREAQERGLKWAWPQSRQELLGWFLKAARSEGVTMISEGQTLDDWEAKGGRSR